MNICIDEAKRPCAAPDLCAALIRPEGVAFLFGRVRRDLCTRAPDYAAAKDAAVDLVWFNLKVCAAVRAREAQDARVCVYCDDGILE